MRKIIILILVVGITGLSGFLSIRILNKSVELEGYARTKQSIHWFRDYIEDDADIKIEEELPIALIFFNPDCDFCQHEAQTFQKNKELLGSIQCYWISDAEQQAIDQFKKKYNIFQRPGLIVVRDSTGILSESAGITNIPQILIYDNSGNLTKEFKGETKIKAILDEVMQPE